MSVASVGGSFIYLKAPYDPELVNACKKIRGRSWTGKDTGWRFPLDQALTVATLADRFHIPISDELHQLVGNVSSCHPRSLARQPESLEWWPKLYPFQQDGVRHMLAHPRMLLGDDMGLGKSIQSLSAALAYNYLPVVILCPPSLVGSWAETVKTWGRLAINVDVLKGNTIRPIRPAHVVICPYSILRTWSRELIRLRPGTLICDEIHSTRNANTQTGQHVLELADSLPADAMILGLSATLVVNRPAELITPLRITRMFDKIVDDTRGRGWLGFVKTYCDAWHNGRNWDISGASNLPQLNTRLHDAGYLRRDKQTVLEQLPPVIYDLVHIPLKADQQRDLRAMESDILAYLRRLDPQRADKAARAEALVRINEMRKYLGMAKAPQIAAWAREWVENSGRNLLLFAWHRDVQQELARLTKSPLLGSGMHTRDLNATIASFQRNEHPILVASLQSMSEGLTLSAAHGVAFAELPWTASRFHQAIGRAYGRLNDAHGVMAYLLNAGFIDDTLLSLVVSKDESGSLVQTGVYDSPLAGVLSMRGQWLTEWDG